MSQRRVLEGRSIRWDEARAQDAYARGLWVRRSLGESLQLCAADAPSRALVIDGMVRLDAAALLREASLLARALLARAEPGSAISFMLPNWHEAAIIYLATQLAGMLANPILP